MVKPVLVFGYGNLSRGDDALGPLLLDYVENQCNLDRIDLLTDFQLQVEHALDLENRELVLFVDASVACATAFGFEKLEASRDKSYTTHAMSPAAVLAVYQSIRQEPPPNCFLLSIKGEQFELGAALSESAGRHLTEACQFAEQLLNNLDFNFWRNHAVPASNPDSLHSETLRPAQHA